MARAAAAEQTRHLQRGLAKHREAKAIAAVARCDSLCAEGQAAFFA